MSLTCDGVVPAGAPITPEPVSEPPSEPGPMSAEALAAKQLFDAGKYDEAIPALRQVMSGSNNDRGNRELAQFRLGVSLLKTGQEKEAVALLSVIARDPTHGARKEMLAWVASAAFENPALVHFLGGFDDRDLETLKQRYPELHPRASYLLGRERYHRNAFADAMFFFSQVNRSSGFSRYAEACIAKIDAMTQARRPTQSALLPLTRSVAAR
jgi:TolA-binding protein